MVKARALAHPGGSFTFRNTSCKRSKENTKAGSDRKKVSTIREQARRGTRFMRIAGLSLPDPQANARILLTFFALGRIGPGLVPSGDSHQGRSPGPRPSTAGRRRDREARPVPPHAAQCRHVPRMTARDALCPARTPLKILKVSARPVHTQLSARFFSARDMFFRIFAVDASHGASYCPRTLARAEDHGKPNRSRGICAHGPVTVA